MEKTSIFVRMAYSTKGLQILFNHDPGEEGERVGKYPAPPSRKLIIRRCNQLSSGDNHGPPTGTGTKQY